MSFAAPESRAPGTSPSPAEARPLLEVLVLGSGTSQGVPMIGCQCEVCLSTDPRDKRTRSSILLRTPEGTILVDTTPELRLQAVREDVRAIDAVLMTHAHADHVMGFDDLRRFCDLNGGHALPVYGSAHTLENLRRIFPYVFQDVPRVIGYLKADPHEIGKAPFTLAGLHVTPLPVPHGAMTTLGFLFQSEGRKLLAYLSDCKRVPDEISALIQGVEVLIIDGLRDKEHPTHLSVGEAIAAGREAKAGQIYLTHLTHEKSHQVRAAELPSGVAQAYDGLRLCMPARSTHS